MSYVLYKHAAIFDYSIKPIWNKSHGATLQGCKY